MRVKHAKARAEQLLPDLCLISHVSHISQCVGKINFRFVLTDHVNLPNWLFVFHTMHTIFSELYALRTKQSIFNRNPSIRFNVLFWQTLLLSNHSHTDHTVWHLSAAVAAVAATTMISISPFLPPSITVSVLCLSHLSLSVWICGEFENQTQTQDREKLSWKYFCREWSRWRQHTIPKTDNSSIML